MPQKENDWSTIEINSAVKNEKVDFEIEEGQEKNSTVKEQSAEPSPGKTDNTELRKDVDVQPEKKAGQVGEEKTGTEVSPTPEELKGIETDGAKKRIRQLIKQRKEREEEIERLRTENQELRQSVGSKETELTNSLKNSIDSTEKQLESRLNGARQAFKTAAESGDSEKMLSAQEELSKVYAQTTALEQQKRAWEEYSERVKTAQEKQKEQSAQRQPPQYDPLAVKWAGKNSWFGQDQILTAAALAIDAELKSEGYDPSDEEFYGEVDKRLHGQFPDRFNQGSTTREEQGYKQTERPRNETSGSGHQVVGGASRTPKTASGGNKVKLTQEDVRLAQKWGIPLEKYAAEKLKVEQAAGEYTSI